MQQVTSEIQTNPQAEVKPVKQPAGRVWVFFVLITVVLAATALIMYSASHTLGINDQVNSLALSFNQTTVAQDPDQAAIELSVLNKQLAENPERPYLGNPDAKLVIVQFGDFQCPLCQQQYAAMRELMAKYDQEVKFIYRHFPSINEQSIVLSEAAQCAYAQDKFWQFHDKAYQILNGGQSATDEIINQIGRQVGLNMEAYTRCLSSNLYQNQVVEDVYDAEALGVRGTPTFFVDGFMLEGVYSFNDWDILIQSVKDQFQDVGN